MYNGQIINQLLAERKIKKKELCLFLNTNNSSIESYINRNPSASNLEKIADFFKVPIDTFFIREVEIPKLPVNDFIEINENNDTISALKELIKEKERTIQILLNQKVI